MEKGKPETQTIFQEALRGPEAEEEDVCQALFDKHCYPSLSKDVDSSEECEAFSEDEYSDEDSQMEEDETEEDFEDYIGEAGNFVIIMLPGPRPVDWNELKSDVNAKSSRKSWFYRLVASCNRIVSCRSV